MLSTDYSCKLGFDMFFGHQPKEKMRILCLYYIRLYWTFIVIHGRSYAWLSNGKYFSEKRFFFLISHLLSNLPLFFFSVYMCLSSLALSGICSHFLSKLSVGQVCLMINLQGQFGVGQEKCRIMENEDKLICNLNIHTCNLSCWLNHCWLETMNFVLVYCVL